MGGNMIDKVKKDRKDKDKKDKSEKKPEDKKDKKAKGTDESKREKGDKKDKEKKDKKADGKSRPATAQAQQQPRRPPPKMPAESSSGGNGYLDGFNLPSSDEEAGYASGGHDSDDNKPLNILVTGRETKKLADKERKALEKAHRMKQEALRDDENVFDVSYEGMGEGVAATATDVKVRLPDCPPRCLVPRLVLNQPSRADCALPPCPSLWASRLLESHVAFSQV